MSIQECIDYNKHVSFLGKRIQSCVLVSIAVKVTSETAHRSSFSGKEPHSKATPRGDIMLWVNKMF
jgi:hypothetical protein